VFADDVYAAGRAENAAILAEEGSGAGFEVFKVHNFAPD
jgi:hypothetical protein